MLGWKKSIVSLCSLIVFSGSAIAEQYAFTGARSSGMAGANTASVRDSSAIWLNPAAFAYMGRKGDTNSFDVAGMSDEDFYWDIFGFNTGLVLTEDMGRYLDILADVDFDAFDSGNLDTPDSVSSLISMAGVLGGLDERDALYADFNAGTSVQIKQFGFGLRIFGEAGAWSVPDLNNLALDDFPDTASLVTDLDTAASGDPGFTASPTYAFNSLTDGQRTQLSGTLGVADDSDTIQYIDFKLGEVIGAGDLTSDEIDAAVDLFDTIASVDPAASIDSNQTVVVGTGYSVVEVPISYGYAINDSFSVGITAKLMYGTVMGANVWVFDENNDQVLDDLSDNYESSLNFGLDLAALYRLRHFQFGLVGHNLNKPSFDGFTETVDVNGTPQTVTIADAEIDPQITFGAAWLPTQRFTLESNIELLETGTVLKDYNIQRFSVGSEVDIWALALRLGTYRNLAEDWQDWVLTGGLGANIFGLRVDVGGAYGLGNKVEYDGSEYPSEARLFGSVGLDF